MPIRKVQFTHASERKLLDESKFWKNLEKIACEVLDLSVPSKEEFQAPRFMLEAIVSKLFQIVDPSNCLLSLAKTSHGGYVSPSV